MMLMMCLYPSFTCSLKKFVKQQKSSLKNERRMRMRIWSEKEKEWMEYDHHHRRIRKESLFLSPKNAFLSFKHSYMMIMMILLYHKKCTEHKFLFIIMTQGFSSFSTKRERNGGERAKKNLRTDVKNAFQNSSRVFSLSLSLFPTKICFLISQV